MTATKVCAIATAIMAAAFPAMHAAATATRGCEAVGGEHVAVLLPAVVLAIWYLAREA